MVTNYVMKNTIEKKITIIIPSREYDANLKYCIKNIRKYYKKISIIVVLDKISKFKKNKNIKIILTKNKTIGFKRNLAVKYCTTKFVYFIDSDAYPKSKWLDEVPNIFKKYKKIGILGGPNLSPKTTNIEKILVSRFRKLFFVTLNPITKSKNQNKITYINFLPSCNMLVPRNLYKRVGGMYENLYSSEEISLNLKIKKLGYKILFYSNIFVYHKDRDFKHFARQRFVYGSTGLRTFLKFPCKASFLLLLSSLPLLFMLSFPLILFSKFYLKIYIYCSIFVIIFSLLTALKMNISNFFSKSFKLVIISLFMPGIGLLSSFIMKDYLIKKLYTQK